MKPGIRLEETKDFGNCVRINLSPKVYSLPTIYAAAYIFLDKVYIILDKEKDGIIVYLFPKKKDNLKTIGMEFLDELINYAHYSTRAAENAENTKAILQRALFSASPSLAQEAEDKEIQELIKDLEEEEKADKKKK